MASVAISVGGVEIMDLKNVTFIYPEGGNAEGIEDGSTVSLSAEQAEQLACDLRAGAEHLDQQKGEVIVWLNFGEQTVTVECR